MISRKILASLLSLVFIFPFQSCSDSETENQFINLAFSQYIVGFTSGIISKKSEIVIQLAEENKHFTSIGDVLDKELFDFSPNIEGVAIWKNNRTIVFQPNESLESGTTYTIEFELGEIVDVEEELEVFEFTLATRIQSFTVNIDGITPYETQKLEWNSFTGNIATADFLEDEKVEDVLKVAQNGTQFTLKWTHNAAGTIHEFVVDSVERKVEPQILLLEWNGNKYDIEIENKLAYEIPSLNDFKIMEVKVIQQPEQHIELRFSDPLKLGQDLNGLIRLEDYSNFKFQVNGNVVKAYPSQRLTGIRYLLLDTEIRNAVNFKMQPTEKYEIEFVEVKPLVRINTDGVILPSTNGLIFPFEAVNLSAVDVKVTKIFENNIHQFFQVNNPMGSYQLTRVGKVMYKKKVNLTSNKAIDFGVWNNFSLDLSELIKSEPGAIYRVSLSFKKSYSMYPCDANEIDLEDEELSDSWDQEVEYEDWGYYDDYEDDYYGYYDYDWKERDNPCNKAYYRTHTGVSKNILASNIGLLVKSGKDKKTLISVTDIVSAKALSGVKLELFDYQNQKIGETSSNSEGLVWIDLKSKPFLLVATNGSEKGYLKLDDGTSLTMSHFDVSGQVVQEGIKGFIFGERGVWRPGDTLFLNFILEDENLVLPKGHPVKFELFDPKGQLKQRMVKTNGLNNFYNFTISTNPDDITGSWLAKVKVGGATFSKYIRIETIKPNRLKIKLEFENEILRANNANNVGEMSVKWLHGAVAKNLKTKVAVTLSPGRTQFKGYEKFNFRDIAKEYTASEQLVYDGKIDENGIAQIPTNIKITEAAPGMLKASFVTRVFEEGGDFSIDRFSMTYSPFSNYVGIKLPQPKSNSTYYTDSTYFAEIITLDEFGKPVDLEGLEVLIYKVSWRWWWDVSRDYLANYTGNNYRNLVLKTNVSTKNGKGQIPFKVTYPDWGRYLIRVVDREGGHSTGNIFYVDWPAWVNRGNKENPGGATVLSFSTNKDAYKVGEEAKVVIPTSGSGRALITVENGSEILEAKWVDVKSKELHHSIKITPEMAPNAYVNVTLVQPHAHNNNLPIRMYGVMPLMVNNPLTHLNPVIRMPSELAPETTVSIGVSEKEGKSMTYVIAMVDEGLLDLTRFKTPNPHSSFYAREALGVKTWDLYDYIIGAYGGEIERVLSIGGDEGINSKEKEKVNRFKPMVKFLGPFELKNGESMHEINIPNYVGSVRTMVIAAQDGAYGSSDKTTPVKKPLMVLATLPRVLGPGEKVKLPVTVFAMDKKIKDVKVKISANKMFKTGFENTKTISFNQPDDQVIMFDLEVLEKIGKGTVHIEVSGAGEKSTYDIELLVRNPNPPQTKYIDAVVNGGSSWTTEYALFGLEGTNEASLELSNMPPVDFERRLKYLLDYPHGCVEQTTSRAFPQLYLKDVIDESTDKRAFQRATENVKLALDKLRLFQQSNGGFSFWPGGNYASDWATTYVGHFMLEAEAKGFVLAPGLKDKWIDYQKRMAKNYDPYSLTSYRGPHWRRYLDMAQAYRLFTLAVAGKPEMGSMNRLKGTNDLDDMGLWRLAAVYYLAGQQDIAKKMVVNLSTYVGTNGNYTNSYTYGSADRDDAMILESMSIMGMRNEALTLSKKISGALTDDRWMSTQTTAYCLMAMVKFAGENGISKEMRFSYSINGKQKDKMISTLPLKMIEIENYSSSQISGNIALDNTGSGLMYARLVYSGVPVKGEEISAENNLKLQLKYVNMAGETVDFTKLEQGTDFIAEVTVTNPNPREYVSDLAITQIFPSGWEIHNTRMDEGPNTHQTDVPEYQDIRDDRVYTYFALNPYSTYNSSHTKTFRILLNASYLGEYYLPAILVESMYDNRINATMAGQWVTVVRPGE